MGSRSAPARTFPGMYNTRYMDDYEAYAREKSDPNILNPRVNRAGFVPGSSLTNKPVFHVGGIPANEHLSKFMHLTPANVSQKGWLPTEVMPVWNRESSEWSRGVSNKYDFVMATFGSQFTINHPDAPKDRFQKSSERIGEAVSNTRHKDMPGGERMVTLNAIGDWEMTVRDRPATGGSASAPDTPREHAALQRPATASSVKEFGFMSKIAQNREKTFLTKSLKESGRTADAAPATWAGVSVENMIDPNANPNNRTRFCRGADNIKPGVMTRPEKFSRYKTTAWGANKTVEKILADGRTRNPGDPFNPIHVDGDLTKVSADAPAWFNIPEVTVMDKTKPQQKVLTQWGAMQDEPYWLTSAEVGELARQTQAHTITGPPSAESAGPFTPAPPSSQRRKQQTETQEKPKKTSPARKGTKYIYKHHVTAESRKAARAAAEASGTVDATRRQQIYSYNTGRNLCLGPNFARDSLHRAIANRGQGTA